MCLLIFIVIEVQFFFLLVNYTCFYLFIYFLFVYLLNRSVSKCQLASSNYVPKRVNTGQLGACSDLPMLSVHINRIPHCQVPAAKNVFLMRFYIFPTDTMPKRWIWKTHVIFTVLLGLSMTFYNHYYMYTVCWWREHSHTNFPALSSHAVAVTSSQINGPIWCTNYMRYRFVR